MHLSGLLVFITACAVTEVAGQMDESFLRSNQLCDDTLVTCSETYAKGAKNMETTNQFYNCVFGVQCERWSEGFYNRQNILGNIKARKEFYDPDTEWWKNEGCKHGLSLACIPLLLAIYKAIKGVLQ